MARFCLVHFFIGFRLVIHFIRVSMICSDQKDAVHFINRFDDAGKREIDRFDTDHCGFQVSGMADHVAVWIIRAQEAVFSGFDRFDELIGNFCRFHPWALFERNDIRLHFHIRFELVIEFLRTVSVPEIRYVTEFLRFADRVFIDSGIDKLFCQCIADLWRLGQIFFRNIEVRIVLEHSGKINVRLVSAVKLVKFVAFVKCAADFLGTVAAEVEEDHAVPVFDLSYRFAVCRNDESRKILVNDAAFLAVCFDRFGRGRELTSLSVNMDVPSFLDHRPVCFVTVHRDLHTSAAACDTGIECIVVEIVHEVFNLVNILQRARFRNVASVKQSVHAHLFYTFFFRFLDQSFQMPDMRVYVSVGKEPDEMHRMIFCAFHEFFPCR